MRWFCIHFCYRALCILFLYFILDSLLLSAVDGSQSLFVSWLWWFSSRVSHVGIGVHSYMQLDSFPFFQDGCVLGGFGTEGVEDLRCCCGLLWGFVFGGAGDAP